MMCVSVLPLRVFVSLTRLVSEGLVFTLNLTGLLQMCVVSEPFYACGRNSFQELLGPRQRAGIQPIQHEGWLIGPILVVR